MLGMILCATVLVVLGLVAISIPVAIIIGAITGQPTCIGWYDNCQCGQCTP